MSRRFQAMVLAIAAVGLPAGWSRAAEPSADEIVARCVEARGGLEAWRKVDTMIWTGHVESSRSPVPSMEFRLEQKRPNKTRMEIVALNDKTLRVFDGARGWKVRIAAGRPDVQPYTIQELRFAQAGHGIDGPLIDHAANGIAVTEEGVDEVAGRKAYHLKVHPAKGGDEDVWVDAGTWMEVRYDRPAQGPSGEPRKVSVTYGDFRTVDGIVIPFLIETGAGAGATPDRLRIQSVVLNTPLDDAEFRSPAKAPLRNRTRRAPPPQPVPPAGVGAASPETDGTTGREEAAPR